MIATSAMESYCRSNMFKSIFKSVGATALTVAFRMLVLLPCPLSDLDTLYTELYMEPGISN